MDGGPVALVQPKRLYDHIQAQVDCLAQHFPREYEQILTLLANGHSPAKIKKWTGIESDVIRRIRELHPEDVSRLKAHLAASLAEAAQCLSERLIAEADTMPITAVTSALSTAIDKHQLLSGGVTARTEHRTVATPEELQAMFDALPKANVTVIEEGTPNGDVRPD
jgi:hypothetical protein